MHTVLKPVYGHRLSVIVNAQRRGAACAGLVKAASDAS
jgi:hypothetical protein